MKTEEEIKDFLNNKVLANISGNTPKVETISIDDFIEWFENKPKEENQDTITFEGKGYEFIEYTWGECCINCDLREHGSCTLSPLICCSEYRRDMREGYFKLIKPKEILVPESIKIIKYKHDQLGLVFNNNKQVLTFSEGVYIVLPLDKWDKFISCRLEKTTFEELHEGDMFFQRENPCDDTLYDEIIFYSIKKDKQNYVYITDTDVNVAEIDSQIIYKVIPIK